MIRKIIISLALVLFLSGSVVYADTIPQPATEENSISNPIQKIQEIGEGTGLTEFNATGQHPDAPPDFAQPGVGTFTSPFYFAIDLFRYLISGVALVMIITSSITLISGATEDDYKGVKNNLTYGILGLILVQSATPLVKKAFFGEQGEAFEDIGTSQLYADETLVLIRSAIGLIEVFIGIIAVLVLIFRGYTVLTSAGDDEAIDKAKTHVGYAVGGLVVILLAEVVVRVFIFPDGGNALPDPDAGKKLLISLVNYASGFISIVAFVALFYGGYQYVVSGGNEEATASTKKIILGAVIGIVLAFGAFAIVNTLITFEPRVSEEGPATPALPSSAR